MSVASLVSDGNVVFLATYKLAKGVVDANYIKYKNKFFAMKDYARAAEKSAVEAQLSVSPLDIHMRMRLAAIQEVERG